MPRLSKAPAGVAITMLLTACVTINVYFPAAAIKDLSRQIEDEVEKKAAPAATPAGAEKPAEKPIEPPPQKPTAGLIAPLFGISAAYAQEGGVAAPEISSPAIRKIIDARAARLAAMNEYKAKGVIGENNQALVEARRLETLADLKARAEVQRLVKAENADREELFKEIAAAKNVELSQLPKIRETYAATLRDKARPGDWVQDASGSWRQK